MEKKPYHLLFSLLLGPYCLIAQHHPPVKSELHGTADHKQQRSMAVVHSSEAGTGFHVRAYVNRGLNAQSTHSLKPQVLQVKAKADSAGCGSTVTRTWTGAGSTQNWTEAANWSNNTVPDCNDHVVFSGVSSKNCVINSHVQVRNITSTIDYKGMMLLDSGHSLTGERLSLSGGSFSLHRHAGRMMVTSFTIGNDVQFAQGDSLLVVSGAMTLAGDATLTAGQGELRCGSLSLGQGTSFTAPGTALFVNGNFSKHKRAAFLHANGTVVLGGNTNATLDLSPGTLQVNGKCDFNRLVLNKGTAGSDNLTTVAGDTVYTRNLEVKDGEFRGNGVLSILDSLMLSGSGDQGCQPDFRIVGAGSSYVVINDLQPFASTAAIQVNKSDEQAEVYAMKQVGGNLQSNLEIEVVQGKLRFDADLDVLQRKNLIVQQKGTLLLPAARQFSLEDGGLTLHGQLEHRQSTFVFSGSQNRRIDFTNGPKTFYNVEINTGTPGAVDPGDITTTGGNDTLVATNRLTFIEAEVRGAAGSLLVTENDLVVRESMGNNTSPGFNHSVCMRGDGNSLYTAEAPWAGGAAANLIIEKSLASNKVIVGKGTASMATLLSGGQLFLNRGVLEFDGTSDARIQSNDKPGILVSDQAGIIAPDNDRLYIEGSWNLAGTFVPQQSTVVLERISGEKMFQHNRAVYFHHLEVGQSGRSFSDPSYRWSWGNAPGSTSDTLWVKGNLTITNNGIRHAHVVVEGDYDNLDLFTPRFHTHLDQLIFKGTAIQRFQTYQFQTTPYEFFDGIKVDKTGGRVDVDEQTSLLRTYFVRGYINPDGNLTLCGAEPVIGGNASACFINPNGYSAVSVKLSSLEPRAAGVHQAWKNGQVEIPLGHTQYGYFPIRLINKDKENEWTVSWIPDAADYYGATAGSNLDSVAGGSGAAVVNDYGVWFVNRATGSLSTQVAVSAAKNPFDPAETVLAWIKRPNNDFYPWLNGGGTVSSFFLTGAGRYFDSNNLIVFALGLSRPKPITQLEGEQPGGNELLLEKAGFLPVTPVSATAGTVRLSAYPNPGNNELNFLLEGSDKGVVVLADMQGKTLARWDLRQSRKVSLSHLAAGTYLLRYTDGMEIITLRWQKI